MSLQSCACCMSGAGGPLLSLTIVQCFKGLTILLACREEARGMFDFGFNNYLQHGFPKARRHLLPSPCAWVC